MKVGQSVIINKPKHASHGLGGDIISINDATKRMQVDLGFAGTWGFNYNEVEPIAKLLNTSANKPTETIKTENMGIASSENKNPVKQAKNKPKEIKITKRGPYKKRQTKVD